MQMPDDMTAVNVNNGFGDIGAVIANALQILGDHDVGQIRIGIVVAALHQ